MPAFNPYNPYSYGQQPLYGSYAAQPIQQIMPQQSYAPPVQPQPRAMEWVEGEIGAIAYQMPPGWPANTPIPLWDNKSTTIYLKSWNQMGVPNPLQKLPYTLPAQQMSLPSEQSGDNNFSGSVAPAEQRMPDMSQYVTKTDFDQLRQEIRNMGNQNMSHGPNNMTNQNGSSGNNNGGNRGGNR